MFKLKYWAVITLALLLFLTGCSAYGKKDKSGSSENKNEEHSLMTDEKQINSEIKRLLEEESYKLIWNIDAPNVREDKLSSWDITAIDTRKLWERLYAEVFANAEIVSEKNELEGTVFELRYKNITFQVYLDNNFIRISGYPETEDYAKIADILAEESRMKCVNKGSILEKEMKECYYFQVDKYSVDLDGRGGINTWFPGSYYCIRYNGDLDISNPIRKVSKAKDISLKGKITSDEIKKLCEIQWKVREMSGVCLLEQMELEYLPDMDGTQLIPVYSLTGKYYEMDQLKNPAAKALVSIIVDAVSGEIIRLDRN